MATDEETASFLGLSPREWLNFGAGALGGLSVGNRNARIYPFMPLVSLAGVMDERRKQDAWSQVAQSLGDHPYADSIKKFMSIGQVAPAMDLFARGLQEKERKAKREAFPLAMDVMGDVSETEMVRPEQPAGEDEEAAAYLPPPTPVETSRPPTLPEIMERVKAIPEDKREWVAQAVEPYVMRVREAAAKKAETAQDYKRALAKIGGPAALRTASPQDLYSYAAEVGGDAGARLTAIARAREQGDFQRERLEWEQTSRADRQKWDRDYREREAQARADREEQRRQDREEAARRAEELRRDLFTQGQQSLMQRHRDRMDLRYDQQALREQQDDSKADEQFRRTYAVMQRDEQNLLREKERASGSRDKARLAEIDVELEALRETKRQMAEDMARRYGYGSGARPRGSVQVPTAPRGQLPALEAPRQQPGAAPADPLSRYFKTPGR